MTVPEIYTKLSSNYVPSYSQTDIITGNGIIQFSAVGTAISGANLNFLSTNTGLYVKNQYTVSSNTTSSSWTSVGAIAFNTQPFSYQRIMTGKVVLEFSRFSYTDTVSVSTGSYANVSLQVVDISGTARTISSAYIAVAEASTLVSTTDCMTLQIPDTVVKIGESIRINFDCMVHADGSHNGRMGICHDPNNQNITIGGVGTVAAATNHTFFRANIPFKVNL